MLKFSLHVALVLFSSSMEAGTNEDYLEAVSVFLSDFSVLSFLSPLFFQDVGEMDLEMLAPYISMDDDFQLTFLSSLPEEVDKPLSSSSDLSTVTPVVTVRRKRYDRPGGLSVGLTQ